MLAFASLLLGLVVGPHPVELLVGGLVAEAELRLDGRRVAALRSEPWSVECDFGTELVPHELVAIGYDDAGHEVARARQWINLPRRPAEAAIVLEGGESGRGVVARLSWESVVGGEPTTAMWLDGQRLPVDDPRRVALPDHDPEEIHLLRAELDFDRNVSTALELVFGGTYVGQASVELTALPLMVEEGQGEPTVETLRGQFRSRGRPLAVAAVERGPAEVVIVRDERIRGKLYRLSRRSAKALRRRARLGTSAAQALRERQRFEMTLDGDSQLRFLWPFPGRRGNELELLSPSRPLTGEDGGIYWLLTEVPAPVGIDDEDQRLADAVAVAGLLAAGRGRRRAVVLVTGGQEDDRSRFAPEAARRYLAQLKVPLYVWSLDASATAWGETTVISSLRQLEVAVEELDRHLGRQRIVWLEGVHIPAEVALDPRPRPETASEPAQVAEGLPLGAPAGAAAGDGLVRAEPGTRLRRLPDPGSPTIAIIDAVVELPVRERRGDWLLVRYGDLLGWAPFSGAGSATPETALYPPPLARARRLLDLDAGKPTAATLGSFELHTDLADPGLLRSLSLLADELPGAFRRRYGLDPGPGTGAVVLFSREADYRAFAAAVGAEPGGASFGHANQGMAVLFAGRQSPEEVAAVLVHELTHLLSRRALATAPPPWLDEGIANDLSFCRIAADGRLLLGTLGGRSVVAEEPVYRPGGWLDIDHAVRLQGPVASLSLLREARLANAAPPLASLVGLSPGEFFAPEGRQLRYDTSAFFVRYLLAGDEGLAERFRSFLAAAADRGSAEPAALLSHLRRGWEELEHGFEAWLASPDPAADYPDGEPAPPTPAAGDGRGGLRYDRR